jgi:hypothetical protein
MLGRASDLEALGYLSRKAFLATKPEELLIAIAHGCGKLIKIIIRKLDPYSVMTTIRDCSPGKLEVGAIRIILTKERKKEPRALQIRHIPHPR